MATINFLDNSGKVISEFESKVKLALSLIGETAEGYAKEDCPVDTGLLRNSITYAVYGEGAQNPSYRADKPGKDGVTHSGTYSGVTPKSDEACVYVGSNVEYARIQEYGDFNHRSGKKHFLRDAVQNHTSEYKDIVETVLKD